MPITSRKLPVFKCAEALLLLRFMVPSTPVSGSEAINSGIKGCSHTHCSKSARARGEMRASRLKPEPLSKSGGSWPKRSRHQASMTALLLAALPRPRCCKPKVKNS